jgi:hypothetical protein
LTGRELACDGVERFCANAGVGCDGDEVVVVPGGHKLELLPQVPTWLIARSRCTSAG